MTENAPISRTTWLRVGGPAEVLFEPADRDDLAAFLSEKPPEIGITVIGVGSNLLVRDGGIPDVTIKLGRAFARIKILRGAVTAGAGALDITVSRTARDAGLGGLEFLSGIPGNIGGALRMNAGAYGRELKDVLTTAEALSGDGQLHEANVDSLCFGYRACGAPKDWIFTQAILRAEPEPPHVITARMEEIGISRETTQPIRKRTGGSTFKNPSNIKAWQLIDAAGCRGMRRGGAEVSDVHSNFLINTGHSTAADVETLGEEVRKRVRDSSGILLEWEIRRVGVPAVRAHRSLS